MIHSIFSAVIVPIPIHSGGGGVAPNVFLAAYLVFNAAFVVWMIVGYIINRIKGDEAPLLSTLWDSVFQEPSILSICFLSLNGFALLMVAIIWLATRL